MAILKKINLPTHRHTLVRKIDPASKVLLHPTVCLMPWSLAPFPGKCGHVVKLRSRYVGT